MANIYTNKAESEDDLSNIPHGLSVGEDPNADFIQNKLNNLVSNLNYQDVIHNTGLGGVRLTPGIASNISSSPITRSGADILRKDPELAANPPQMSQFGRPFHELEYTYTPKNNLSAYKEISPEQLYNEQAFITPAVGDRSAANYLINSIQGNQLRQPVNLSGGGDFQRSEFAEGQNPAAWASRDAAVKNMLTKITQQNVPKNRPLYMSHTLMGIPSADSSHMMSQALLRQINPELLTPEAITAINKSLQGSIKNFPGIENPQDLENLLQKNNVGSETSLIAKALDKSKAVAGGGPDVGAARFAVTDPRLFSPEQLATGYSLSKIDLSKPPIQPEDGHQTYPTQIPSVSGYEGGLKYQVPADIMFPDWAEKQLKTDKNGNPLTATMKQQSLMTQMPVQEANQKWLDNIMQHLENHKKVWGYGQGGTVGDNSMNEHIRHALRIAQELGRGGDTILAHINPREAALLKKRGGSGKINPRTGLIEFDEGDTKDSETKDSETKDSETKDTSTNDSGSNYSGGWGNYGSYGEAQVKNYGAPEGDTTAKTTKDDSFSSWLGNTLADVGNAIISPAEAATPAAPSPSGMGYNNQFSTLDTTPAISTPVGSAGPSPTLGDYNSAAGAGYEPSVMNYPTSGTFNVGPTSPISEVSGDPNNPASYNIPSGTSPYSEASPYGTNTPLLGGGVDPADRATAKAAKFQLDSQAADAENAALNAAADASVAAGVPAVTTFGTPILQSGTFTGGGEPTDVGSAVKYADQFGRNPAEGYGTTDVVAKALDVASPTGDSSIYSYTPPKETTDTVTTLGGTAVPLPIARPEDAGTTDTNGNPIVPKTTGGAGATADAIKAAADASGSLPDEVYRDLINQPGWGSEDPGLIADFNKYAFEKYGLKLGPTTKSGEISVGQTTPEVMVPKVNADGSVTMVPTLGSVINTALEKTFNKPVYIGSKEYADLGGSNVGTTKAVIPTTTSTTTGTTTDTTIKPSQHDVVTPVTTTDTTKTADKTIATPVFAVNKANYVAPATTTYKDLGASTGLIKVNPINYRNTIDWTKVPGYRAASGGRIGENNALANTMRMLKMQNKL